MQSGVLRFDNGFRIVAYDYDNKDPQKKLKRRQGMAHRGRGEEIVAMVAATVEERAARAGDDHTDETGAAPQLSNHGRGRRGFPGPGGGPTTLGSFECASSM